MRRVLTTLEHENARLKRLIAKKELDDDILRVALRENRDPEPEAGRCVSPC